MKTDIYNLNNLINLGWSITEHNKQYGIYTLINGSNTLTAQVYEQSGNVFYYLTN